MNKKDSNKRIAYIRQKSECAAVKTGNVTNDIDIFAYADAAYESIKIVKAISDLEDEKKCLNADIEKAKEKMRLLKEKYFEHEEKSKRQIDDIQEENNRLRSVLLKLKNDKLVMEKRVSEKQERKSSIKESRKLYENAKSHLESQEKSLAKHERQFELVDSDGFKNDFKNILKLLSS